MIAKYKKKREKKIKKKELFRWSKRFEVGKKEILLKFNRR